MVEKSFIHPTGTVGSTGIVICPQCGGFINLKVSNKCYYCGYIHTIE